MGGWHGDRHRGRHNVGCRGYRGVLSGAGGDAVSMERSLLNATTDLLAQIREAVDADSADPNEWYRMILKVRELVGITR